MLDILMLLCHEVGVSMPLYLVTVLGGATVKFAVYVVGGAGGELGFVDW